MRYDDRLLTVLNQPAGDRHDAAVRWRQLVDLVARAGSNASSPTVAEALDSIRSDSGNVDENLRAAAARAVAALPLPLGLLEYFASDRLAVSAPVLAAATLNSEQWQALMAAADEETRQFIETLHPEVRSEASDLTPTLVEEAQPRPSAVTPPSGITPSLHEVVARIERRRRHRAAAEASLARSVSMPAGPPSLFRWECGPGGEIAWIEGAPRGALIGRSIARQQDGDGDRIDTEVLRAFAMRAPFRDGVLTLAGDGPLAGEWKLSGVPAFEPADGRFAGYRGIALRDDAEPPAEEAPDVLADPDSLRELVHEIKTPLNAIIGFAEIIEGQYLGPADHRYRERASEIVEQARLLLTAIDDVDFAAKVHSTSGGARPRVNLDELVERIAPALRERARARGIELEWSRSGKRVTAAIEPELADRLIFRICSASIDRAEAGERLRLSVDDTSNHSTVAITRPKALSGLSDQQLFGGGEGIGQTFSLRLARGLARIAGGDVTSTKAAILLVLQRA